VKPWPQVMTGFWAPGGVGADVVRVIVAPVAPTVKAVDVAEYAERDALAVDHGPVRDCGPALELGLGDVFHGHRALDALSPQGRQVGGAGPDGAAGGGQHE